MFSSHADLAFFQDGEATDFPLTAAIPAGTECTGTVAGQDNVCLVRCQNSARAGPFGGVSIIVIPYILLLLSFERIANAAALQSGRPRTDGKHHHAG
jgi:hypothetical protein